jgi:hypothetical protein
VSQESTLAERVTHVRRCLDDALKWTEPADLADYDDAFPAFAQGLDLLTKEFSEDVEEAWLLRLLQAGWFIVPAADDPRLPALQEGQER